MAMTQEWMVYFQPKDVEEILRGKEPTESLLFCFRFGLTPEGFDYWWEVASKSKLGSKVRTRLEEMLTQYANAGESRRNSKP